MHVLPKACLTLAMILLESTTQVSPIRTAQWQSLMEICHHNGWSRLRLISTKESPSRQDLFLLSKSASLKNVWLSSRPETTTDKELILVNSLASLVTEFSKGGHLTLTVLQTSDSLDENSIEEALAVVKAVNLFGLVAIFQGELVNPDLYLVICTKRFLSPVVNKLDVIQHRIKFDFNLKGRTLEGITLPFDPYVIENNEGDLSGLLIDIESQVGSMYNFTFTNYLEPNQEWGVQPVTGDFVNGTFAGVMGGVINDEFDLSLSTWLSDTFRQPVLDMTATFYGPLVMALTPQAREFDFELFIRPFRTEVWYCIVAISILVLVLLFSLQLSLTRFYESTDGFFLLCFSGWCFFTLVYSYYGGALTMFFTSDFRVPFSNVKEVMRAYPTWKLTYMAGNEVYFYPKAELGVPEFVKFVDLVQTDPESRPFDSVLEGLERMRSGQNVIFVNQGMLTSVFKANPLLSQNVIMFGLGEFAIWPNIIFPKHSPLKPMFDEGLLQLRERGVISKLQASWEGTSIPKHIGQSKEILSFGQTMMVYLVIGTGLFVSIFVLTFEYLFQHCGWHWFCNCLSH